MPIGTIVHRPECVASTNDSARALALEGAAHGTAVLAREQTRGRGTRDRTWHSPAGLGLYSSFVLRGPGGGPVPFPHLLPLAAGLAAADAVRAETGIEVRLKWPNDLVLAGKKLGGILCEGVSGAAGGDFAVVGVGINVGHGPGDFPERIRLRSTSLRIEGAGRVTVGALFDGLCRALDCWYNVLARGEKEAVVGTFEARLAFPPGAPIRAETAAGRIEGTCRGLDTEGRLVLERAGGKGTIVLDAVLGLDGAP